ncbi:erythromycin esterase family protein [Pedosphaera parvula]|nr:erythromycin esterase family protein [Pedosphaera parvula]
MALGISSSLIDLIREVAIPLTGSSCDYDFLLESIGDARFVLLGEATHGTHEFYRTRAEITKRLIIEKGFTAVAVEADWPDAHRVNRYIRSDSEDVEASEALGNFKRFPLWMWRNADVLDLVGWLREHNDQVNANEKRVGFYGMDLYSLHASIRAVLDYLDRIDPDAGKRARGRYSCFEQHGENPQAYGYAASFDLSESCQQEAVSELVELRRRAGAYLAGDGRLAEDEFFYAEQNARLVKNAEEYYRVMFQGHIESWNLRDRHMAETLEALSLHLERQVHSPKIVVWAHNSHLGDARATQMGDRGEWNVGQLVRERHGSQAVLVGFTTYHGTVTAASEWDEPAQLKRVRSALRGSYETLFHETGVSNFLLPLQEERELKESLQEARLERAIGVIYRPETERMSHYFHARLSEQFDFIIHFDKTRAVEPLERTMHWEPHDPDETYPFGV